MQPFKFGIKSIAAKATLKYDIELVMLVSYITNMEVKMRILNQVLHMMSWLLNDSEDIFFGGTDTKIF